MEHFRDEEWLDYVRGLSAPEQRAVMSLSEGCEECIRLFSFWRTTVEVAVRDLGYQVPDVAIESAMEAYAIWTERYRLQSTARRSHRIFDSFLQPAMAGFRGSEFVTGFRGSDTASRRVVQRAGRWNIDLRLEREGRDRVSMAGQTLLAVGKTAGAETVVNDLLLHDSTDGAANLTMARINVREGDVADAGSYYHRAIYGRWPVDPAEHRTEVRLELIDFLARQDVARQNAKQELLAELLAVEDQVSDINTLHSPWRVAKVGGDSPQRYEEPTPLGQAVIARCRFLTTRTAPAYAGMRFYGCGGLFKHPLSIGVAPW